MKNLRFLSVIAILVIVLATIIGTSVASAQTVCSPATPISVPFSKDGLGTFCWQTTTLCNNINSWNISPKLEINGTSYANIWVLASSIAPLNGVYTITYESSVVPFSHFEIAGPCSGGGPTATLTLTIPPTRTPTGTGTGRSQTPGPSPVTRTITPNASFTATRTPTRTSTPTPCGYPSTCVTPNTPTRTPATVVPTWTPSNTPATPVPTLPGGICTPATTITAPFLFSRFNTPPDDVVGTHCWRINSVGFINSFNLTNLSVNGVNMTNIWAAASSFPPQIDGWWYINHTSQVIWGHFEAQP